jgi:hypothetical protein
MEQLKTMNDFMSQMQSEINQTKDGTLTPEQARVVFNGRRIQAKVLEIWLQMRKYLDKSSHGRELPI